MPSGNARTGQADFGAGIYRGRESPPNAAYDLLNCLIDNEGQPFRRGGSAYYRNAIAGTDPFLGIFSYHLAAVGERVTAWTAPNLYDATDTGTPVTLAIAGFSEAFPLGRMANLGQMAVFPQTQNEFVTYGGSKKTANYSTGQATVTNGSRTVTGTGTTWTTNVDPGMLFSGATVKQYAVASVDSNTQLTLTQAVDDAGGLSGVSAVYLLEVAHSWLMPAHLRGKQMFVAAVGSPARLLLATGNRVDFSNPGEISQLLSTSSTNYHEIATAGIVGLDSLRNTARVFTPEGMWEISNMEFDPVDDVGNVQHVVEQINELILWGDPGVAKWRGAHIVPGINQVWLVESDGKTTPIADGILPLYRTYVEAGYQPGIATVYRSHYILPILNGTTLVDQLLCRLDQGFAWTRWSGHGTGRAWAQRVGATTRSPKLLGVTGQRITELTGAWTPTSSNASEADGTTHPLDIITRDYPTPGGAKGSTTKRVRFRYQATAAGTPTFTVSYARGPEDAAFTSVSLLHAGGASDGLDESAWLIGKRAPAIRFRIQSSSALSTFTLREVEAHYLQRDE